MLFCVPPATWAARPLPLPLLAASGRATGCTLHSGLGIFDLSSEHAVVVGMRTMSLALAQHGAKCMRTAWLLATQLPGGGPALIVSLLPRTKARLAQLVEARTVQCASAAHPSRRAWVPMPCRKLPHKLDFLL